MVTHKSIGGQKWAYYNEIDPYAAEWLRSLIRSGHIANGIVDERSISDVRPDELQEFTQCHFFAGIGVWSYALRSAGWEDDRPVWTGSCPCQPFSNAGSRKGITDERHLWPHWFHLIEQCRPSTVFGEQVASKDGLGWIDLVQADMEGADYAIGSFDLCSAGFGAPHIRQRLWFVADTDNTRSQGRISGRTDSKWQDKHGHLGRNGSTIGMGDPDIDDGRNEDSAVTSEREARLEHGGASPTSRMADTFKFDRRSDKKPKKPKERTGGESFSDNGFDGRMGNSDNGGSQGSGKTGVGQGMEQSGSQSTRTESDFGMAYTASSGRQYEPSEKSTGVQSKEIGDTGRRTELSGHGASTNGANETNGFWRDTDWLLCRDGKWRPVEPDTFPLAHGATARVGRLRAYGNAITAQVAQGLIESYMEVKDD
tara:strand:+ start:1720 stop:2994 length:1275 start_codon:yes stop_codon:yes gene_type:complete